MCDYLTPSGNWDLTLLEQLLPHDALLRLARFKINEGSIEKDEIILSKSSSGKFTTKLAFDLISPAEVGPAGSLLKILWKVQIPHRIQMLNWLAYQDRFLTNVLQ